MGVSLVVESSRPPLVCRECDGTGTDEEPYCPRGCSDFGRAPSCTHEQYRAVPCPAPDCLLGYVQCAAPGCWDNAVVRTEHGGLCAEHEDDAAAGSLIQPPLESAGAPEGFERNTAGLCGETGRRVTRNCGSFSQ